MRKGFKCWTQQVINICLDAFPLCILTLSASEVARKSLKCGKGRPIVQALHKARECWEYITVSFRVSIPI